MKGGKKTIWTPPILPGEIVSYDAIEVERDMAERRETLKNACKRLEQETQKQAERIDPKQGTATMAFSDFKKYYCLIIIFRSILGVFLDQKTSQITLVQHFQVWQLQLDVHHRSISRILRAQVKINQKTTGDNCKRLLWEANCFGHEVKFSKVIGSLVNLCHLLYYIVTDQSNATQT